MDEVTSERPACFVVVFNIGKKHNVGTLLRSCTAFGVKQVRVGQRRCLSKPLSD
jgi:tRNA G18 (ribose-2'-O)-methylase SpoU